MKAPFKILFRTVLPCGAIMLLFAIGAWFAATQPPWLARRVVRSVRNWLCPGNGKTVEENIVDHFKRAGRPPVRLDWSPHLVEDLPLDWEIQAVHCTVALPDGTSAKLGFWPGSFWGEPVKAFDWTAVEACPGVEPSEFLLFVEKEDFYWKWARFGRDWSLSHIHPERFRWQKRNGFDAEDRLSFEPESGVAPEFVRAALDVARDASYSAEDRAHALEELRALPAIPEDLAPEVSRLLATSSSAADESHAEAAEFTSRAETAEAAELESHAESAKFAEPEPGEGREPGRECVRSSLSPRAPLPEGSRDEIASARMRRAVPERRSREGGEAPASGPPFAPFALTSSTSSTR